VNLFTFAAWGGYPALYFFCFVKSETLSKEAIMSEDAKKRILEWMQAQKKTKQYFNDICKAVPEMKMRDAKKIINALVTEGKLKYWSSGSTTMYMLPTAGDVEKEEKGMTE
jgi:hypothetical protein